MQVIIPSLNPQYIGVGEQSIHSSLSESQLGLMGGIDWLKQLEKKLFSMVAFSLSVVAVSPE